jgi:S-phase kinase-associated protein 1
MKKFLCLLALASWVSLVGMDTDTVTLHSSDGQEFKIEVRIAKLSETIKNLIEEAGIENPIPMPNITGKTLAKIIGYMKNIKDGKPINLKDELYEDLAGITLAANYLDILIPAEGAAPAESLLKKYAVPECARRMFDAHLDKLTSAKNYAIYKRLFLDPLNSVPDIRKLILNHVWPTLVSEFTTPIAIFPHNREVRAVAFSSDGQYITTTSRNTARLWKAEPNQNPQPIATFPHNPHSEITPAGYIISTVSSGSKTTFKLWNIQNGIEKLIATFPHNWLVNSYAFSPDGKYRVSVSDDNANTAKLWRVNPINIAKINLTQLDLASAQIIIYILRKGIRTFNNIPQYLKDALNPYAREFLEKNM